MQQRNRRLVKVLTSCFNRGFFDAYCRSVCGNLGSAMCCFCQRPSGFGCEHARSRRRNRCGRCGDKGAIRHLGLSPETHGGSASYPLRSGRRSVKLWPRQQPTSRRGTRPHRLCSCRQARMTRWSPSAPANTLRSSSRRSKTAMSKNSTRSNCSCSKISANGETVPVGKPALVVGREGTIQCKSLTGDCPLTLKVQVKETEAVAAEQEAGAAEPSDGSYCSGPDCGQPETELSENKVGCAVSCRGQAGECTCSDCDGNCPASCNGSCAVSGEVHVCSGTCASCATKSAKCNCAPCKCGVCKCGSGDGASESASCTSASCAASNDSATCAAGSCECASCESSLCEAPSSECAACKAKCGSAKGKCGSCSCDGQCTAACKDQSRACCGTSTESSSQLPALTGDEYRALVRILVSQWVREHQDHGVELSREQADSDPCPGHASCGEEGLITPSIDVYLPTERRGVDLGAPAPVPSTCEGVPATSQTAPRWAWKASRPPNAHADSCF